LGLPQQGGDGPAQGVRRNTGVAVTVTAGFVQSLADGDLGCRVGDQMAEEVEERRAGVRGVEQRLGPLAQVVEPSHENGLHQGCLGGEVAEDRGDADAGQAGHLLGRRGLAALAEDIVRDLQDAATVAACVGAHRPPTAGVPLARSAHRSFAPPHCGPATSPPPESAAGSTRSWQP
jgi:hypothetical protein